MQKAAPAGAQKRAGTEYPDAGAEISGMRFQLGAKRREEYGRMLAKHRPDLDADKVLAELDKYDNPKKEKVALHWTVRGAIRLPEDEYKVDEALSVAEKAKVDPFKYRSPMELLEAHKEFKPTAKAIDPETVPELSDRRDEGDGIVSYEVEDTREGQAAMRRIIDTHWGEEANPWCLLARNYNNSSYSSEFRDWVVDTYGDGIDDLMSYERREAIEKYRIETGRNIYEEAGSLDNAWGYWQRYSALPKRVAFKNGKLLAFMATTGADYDTIVDRYYAFNGGILEKFPELRDEFYEWQGIHFDDPQTWLLENYPDKFHEYDESFRKENPEYYTQTEWWDRQDESHVDLDWARGAEEADRRYQVVPIGGRDVAEADVDEGSQIVRHQIASNPRLLEDIKAALQKRESKDSTVVQKKRHDDIVLSEDLPFFEFLGLPNRKVVTDVTRMRKIVKKHHLTPEQAAELPNRYNAPVAVMQDGDDGFVVLTDLRGQTDHGETKPVRVFLRPTTWKKNGEIVLLATALSENAGDEEEYYTPRIRGGLLFVDEKKLAGLGLEEGTESTLRTQASDERVLTASDYSKWSTFRSETQSTGKVNGENGGGRRLQKATPARDWSHVTIPEMRRELVRRGLSVAGGADMLRKRLAEDDGRRFQLAGEPFRLEQQSVEEIVAENAAAKQQQKQEAAARAKEAAERAKAEAARRQEQDELYQGRLDIGVPGETGSLFAPRQNARSGGNGTTGQLFQKAGTAPDGGELPWVQGEWDGALVKERGKLRKRWDIVGKDGKVLSGGYGSEAAARWEIERRGAAMEVVGEALKKLDRGKVEAIAEARRRLVELSADAKATAARKAEMLKEVAEAMGLHPKLAEKEAALAERILKASTPGDVAEAEKAANRALETVLARASIRLYRDEMEKFAKEKAAGSVVGGVRRRAMLSVAEAMKMARQAMTPKEKQKELKRLEDASTRVNNDLNEGETDEVRGGNTVRVPLTSEKRKELERLYDELETKKRLLPTFGGLESMHGGKDLLGLTADVRAWKEASEELKRIADGDIDKMLRKDQARRDQAEADREGIIDEMTGGKGIPLSNAMRRGEAVKGGWRRKAADWFRGLIARHMAGGREMGELLQYSTGVAVREGKASRLFHEGRMAGQNRELEMNDEDADAAKAILVKHLGVDPDASWKGTVDYSEKCGQLFRDKAEGITLRSVLRARYGGQYGVRGLDGLRKRASGVYSVKVTGPCELSLGELMSVYLWGLQAEAAAGQEYNDAPKQRANNDVTLMEALTERGFSAETMMEIRRELAKRGLDKMAEEISADMERKADGLDALMQEYYHARLKRTPYYAPLRREHYGLNEETDENGVARFMGMTRSFLKERVANHRDFEPTNLITRWQMHNRQANHILALHEWISRTGLAFQHRDMQAAMKYVVGDEARKAINLWLNAQARGGAIRRTDDSAFDAVARNFAGAVTVNPRVTLKQTTSGSMALPYLPEWASTTQWLADMAAIHWPPNRRKFLKMLEEKSPVWRNRGISGSDAQQMTHEHVAGSRSSLLRMKVARALGAMTRWGDREGALSGCYGIYMAWYRKLKDDGMAEEDAQAAALDRFADAVNGGQQSSLNEYNSVVQNAGGAWKLIYAFHTAQAAMTRNFYIHARALAMHRGPPRQHIRALAGIVVSDWLFRMMGSAMMPLVLLVRGLFDKNVEKEEKQEAAWDAAKGLVVSAVNAPLGGIRIAGDVLADAVDFALDKAVGKKNVRQWEPSSDIIPAAAVLDQAARTLNKAFKDEKSLDDWKYIAENLVDLTGETTGVALGPILSDLPAGIVDALTAKDLRPEQRVARAMSFSRSAIGAPKRKPAPKPAPSIPENDPWAMPASDPWSATYTPPAGLRTTPRR